MREAYRKTLLVLEANPHHPLLGVHALRGRFEGLHSVSINLSYRITLEVLIEDQTLMPIDVGSPDLVFRT